MQQTLMMIKPDAVERNLVGEVLGRVEGSEHRLEVTADRVAYSGPGFNLIFHENDPEGTMDGECAGEVDLTIYYIMDLMRRGIFDPSQVNYINSFVSEGAES